VQIEVCSGFEANLLKDYGRISRKDDDLGNWGLFSNLSENAYAFSVRRRSVQYHHVRLKGTNKFGGITAAAGRPNQLTPVD